MGFRGLHSFEENVIITTDPRGVRWRGVGGGAICTNRKWTAIVSIKAYRARGQLISGPLILFRICSSAVADVAHLPRTSEDRGKLQMETKLEYNTGHTL
jgi:hypothetical protein